METISYNVKDIDPDKRQWLEASIGKHLDDNQRVIIRVLTPDVEPDEVVRDAALAEAIRIAKQGRDNAAEQGVTADEAGLLIDEAIEQARLQKRT
jgi:hypothetical protein